jgi:hypothetical protein
MYRPPGVSWPLQAPSSGSAAAPAYDFASERTGLFLQAAGKLGLGVAGTERGRLSSAGLDLGAASLLLGASIGSPDWGATRLSAGRGQISDGGANPGKLLLAPGSIGSGVAGLTFTNLNTGIGHDTSATAVMYFYMGGGAWAGVYTGGLCVDSSGKMAFCSGAVTTAKDTAQGRVSAGLCRDEDGSGNLRDRSLRNIIGQTGYTEMLEMTAPAAPAANAVRIYAEDDGAGKTRLMALFSSGAAQQIAIQP